LDGVAIGTAPAQPGVLHDILGIGTHAEHAVGNGKQARPVPPAVLETPARSAPGTPPPHPCTASITPHISCQIRKRKTGAADS
jgi:hypothetical protein